MRPSPRRRLLLIPAVAALLAGLPAAGKPNDDERAVQKLPGWGEVTDPDKDCKFKVEKEKLTITVPETLHDLSAEVGDMTAPRVLRDVEGDFEARVKVAGEVLHKGDRTSQHFLAYHGAGLLVWVDDKTYIRLERACYLSGDQPTHYVNFELRQDGEVPYRESKILPDAATWVRLTREGGKIVGATSQDGKEWDEFEKPIEAELPAKLKVGVGAVSTSTEEFKAELVDLKISTPKDKEAQP